MLKRSRNVLRRNTSPERDVIRRFIFVKPQTAQGWFEKETMSEQSKTFLAGVRAEIPLLIGVFPFGLIYGALALNAGLSPWPRN